MKVEECRIEGMGIKKWKGKPIRYLGMSVPHGSGDFFTLTIG